VDGKRNAKVGKSSKEDIISSVEESTIKSEVDTNDSSNKDDVDLYILETILKLQEEDMPLIVILRNDEDIEKVVFLITLGKDLTCKEKVNIQGLICEYHHLLATNYKDLKRWFWNNTI
jgi:hypothetical protein